MKGEIEIVLIEDSVNEARRLLQFLKKNFRNEVRLIQDEVEASEFFLFESYATPKLILLDMVLPLNGNKLLQRIASETERSNLSVMLIVSLKSKEYLQSIDVHPDGYLKKSEK